MGDDRPAIEKSKKSRQAEEARARVVVALECLERSERDALDGLQHALCSYVSALRADGLSSEEATKLITKLVGSPATRDGGLVVLPAVRSALVELAVGWCLTEYGRLDSAEGDRSRVKASDAKNRESSPPPS